VIPYGKITVDFASTATECRTNIGRCVNPESVSHSAMCRLYFSFQFTVDVVRVETSKILLKPLFGALICFRSPHPNTSLNVPRDLKYKASGVPVYFQLLLCTFTHRDSQAELT